MSEEKIFKLEGFISQQTIEALVKGFKGGNQCQTLLGGRIWKDIYYGKYYSNPE